MTEKTTRDGLLAQVDCSGTPRTSPPDEVHLMEGHALAQKPLGSAPGVIRATTFVGVPNPPAPPPSGVRSHPASAASGRPSNVSLANWRTTPYSRWAFQHVTELITCSIIRADPSRKASPAPASELGELASVVGSLVQLETDSMVVLRNGVPVGEWYAANVDPLCPHLMFSISKSIAGLLAGVLVERGVLDLHATVMSYLPDYANSAYEDATVRDLLDMTVSTDFEEVYLEPNSMYGRYRSAMLWNPEQNGEASIGLRRVLHEIKKGPKPHGESHAYRSPNSDVLGLVLEEAAGVPMNELIEQVLWGPTGMTSDATMTVDRFGMSRVAGGMSMTTRDLARLGQLVLQDGEWNGDSLVPSAWIHDLWHGGKQSAWLTGDQATLFPHGNYRSSWYLSGDDELAGIGIHGQWIWIDRAASVVIAKCSSQALPVDEAIDHENIALFRQIARMNP